MPAEKRLPVHDATEWQRRAETQLEARSESEVREQELATQLLQAEETISALTAQVGVLQGGTSFPAQWYVRDETSPAAHILDDARRPYDQAICGHAFASIRWQGEARPKAVCKSCQENKAEHERQWWQRLAQSERAEREEMEASWVALRHQLDEQQELISRQWNTIDRLKSRLTGPKPSTQKPSKRRRQPPPIKVVSAGLPTLGKRR